MLLVLFLVIVIIIICYYCCYLILLLLLYMYICINGDISIKAIVITTPPPNLSVSLTGIELRSITHQTGALPLAYWLLLFI